MDLFLAQTTVIVYRSRQEQLADEFWTDFWSNYPWVFYVGVGLFAAFWLAVAISILRTNLRMRRQRRNGWSR
jgi:hypothetical protein